MISSPSGTVRQLRTADLDGDGDEDVVSLADTGLVWFENTGGQGESGGPIQIAGTVDCCSRVLLTADVDGDSDIDLLVAGNLYRNEDGSGAFSEPEFAWPFDDSFWAEPYSAHLADMDGDDDLDIVYVFSFGGIEWSENIDGKFSAGS